MECAKFNSTRAFSARAARISYKIILSFRANVAVDFLAFRLFILLHEQFIGRFVCDDSHLQRGAECFLFFPSFGDFQFACHLGGWLCVG